MRVLVYAPVGTSFGYGKDGVGLIKGLVARGHSVDLVPSSVTPPIPPAVAQLLTFPTGTDYDLEIHHVPPTGAGVYLPSSKRSRRTVLWTMWEWYTFPESVPNYTQAQNGISRYSDVVGYTQQTLDTFKESGFLREDQNLHVLQGGVDLDAWTTREDPKVSEQASKVPVKAYDSPYVFAMVGVMAVRKNPYGVLRAFNDLKDEMGDDFNAELVVKTDFPFVPEGYNAPGVKIIRDAQWTEEQMRMFYWSIDCLVNCAWGEGKDLPALEATLCGTPTLLNNTPGHQGWVHPSIKSLVPASMQPMNDVYTGRYTGIKDIKDRMLHMATHRKDYIRTAEEMRSYVAKRMSWEWKVQKLGEELGLPL